MPPGFSKGGVFVTASGAGADVVGIGGGSAGGVLGGSTTAFVHAASRTSAVGHRTDAVRIAIA
jgi:hypothetical protein